MTPPETASSFQCLAHSLAQATSAARKGFRDGTQKSVLSFSILTSLAAFFFWLWIFILARNPIWAASMKAADWALPWLNEAPSLLEKTFLGLVALCLCLIAFGLLVILTIQLVLEWFLMPRIQTLCLPQYPSLAQHNISEHCWRGWMDLAKLWGALLAGMLLWVIPLVGALIFFVLTAYINVRLLINDVLSELATTHERAQIVKRHRHGLLLLGLMMTGLWVIPFAGLVMPAVLGASVSHFAYAALANLRASPTE